MQTNIPAEGTCILIDKGSQSHARSSKLGMVATPPSKSHGAEVAMAAGPPRACEFIKFNIEGTLYMLSEGKFT
jgi:hypothetical protein